MQSDIRNLRELSDLTWEDADELGRELADRYSLPEDKTMHFSRSCVLALKQFAADVEAEKHTRKPNIQTAARNARRAAKRTLGLERRKTPRPKALSTANEDLRNAINELREIAFGDPLVSRELIRFSLELSPPACVICDEPSENCGCRSWEGRIRGTDSVTGLPEFALSSCATAEELDPETYGSKEQRIALLELIIRAYPRFERGEVGRPRHERNQELVSRIAYAYERVFDKSVRTNNLVAVDILTDMLEWVRGIEFNLEHRIRNWEAGRDDYLLELANWD